MIDRLETRRTQNTPEEVAAVVAMRYTLRFLGEICSQHADGHPMGECKCDQCRDANGAAWAIQWMESLISGELLAISQDAQLSAAEFLRTTSHVSRDKKQKKVAI